MPERRRIHALDGVRGLAALFVVFHHAWLTAFTDFRRETGPLNFLKFGHYGVVLFIVLSGMSLGLSVVDDEGKLRYRFRDYMRRRLWRIVPPYWCALAISAVLAGLFLRQPSGTHWDQTLPFSIKDTLLGLLLIHDFVLLKLPNHAYWSIPIEVPLYLIVPLLVSLRRIANPAVPLIAAWAMAECAYVHPSFGSITPDPALFVFCASLALGLFAADLVRHPRVPWRRPSLIVGAMCGVAALTWIAILLPHGTPPAGDELSTLDLLFSAGAASALVVIAGSSRSVLRARPLVALGGFSYSLYLLHAPMLEIFWRTVAVHMATTTTARFWLVLGPGTAVCVIVAAILSRWIERPFMQHRSFRELLRASRGSSGTATESRSRVPSMPR